MINRPRVLDSEFPSHMQAEIDPGQRKCLGENLCSAPDLTPQLARLIKRLLAAPVPGGPTSMSFIVYSS
jgi:hypothetical protein